MKALVVVASIVLMVSGVAVAADERVGQDPDGAVDVLPGGGEPGERVGNDPDVPGGEAPGTPVAGGPGERVGNDPNVPDGDEPVR
jgi:hypothetical protein